MHLISGRSANFFPLVELEIFSCLSERAKHGLSIRKGREDHKPDTRSVLRVKFGP